MTIGDRLRYARERAGLTMRQVEDAVGIGCSSLSEFERNHREPSLSHLQLLATHYKRGIEFFFAKQDIGRELILWRKKPSDEVASAIETAFLQLCTQFQNLENWNNENVPCRLPQVAETHKGPITNSVAEELAYRVRCDLKLGDRPGPSLLSVLEEVCGVKVFHLAFEPSGTAACTVSPDFGGAVLLNSKNVRWRRNFDLAHELFHLLTWTHFRHEDETSASSASEAEEALANRFASSLLMPAEVTRVAISTASVSGKVTYDELFDIARQFDVSVEALLWRMTTLFQIPAEKTREQIDKCRGMAVLLEKREHDVPPERPDRFCALAIQGLNKGNLSAGRLAEYLGITRMEAQTYVAQAVTDEQIEVPSD